VIAKYEQDGLAHQRYKRANAEGAGDDILANNVNAIVGLYRNIYGIRPQYNRLFIEPHLTSELSGTQIKYNLRNNNYLIDLKIDNTTVSVDNFTVSSKGFFAINPVKGQMEYFIRNNEQPSVKIKCSNKCIIEITDEKNAISWEQSAAADNTAIGYTLCGLDPAKRYSVYINNKLLKKAAPDVSKEVNFEIVAGKRTDKLEVKPE